jgi:hypothetical protein
MVQCQKLLSNPLADCRGAGIGVDTGYEKPVFGHPYTYSRGVNKSPQPGNMGFAGVCPPATKGPKLAAE